SGPLRHGWIRAAPGDDTAVAVPLRVVVQFPDFAHVPTVEHQDLVSAAVRVMQNEAPERSAFGHGVDDAVEDVEPAGLGRDRDARHGGGRGNLVRTAQVIVGGDGQVNQAAHVEVDAGEVDDAGGQ